jgi:hypothetical protein
MAKTTNNAMNRVPPFMPIIWQEWESNPDTGSMTDLQVGIFLKMLLRQWVVGSVPANVSDIIRECKLDSGRNTVLRFLESYPHLWTCDGCGADFVQTECGCSTDASRTFDGCSTDARRTGSVRRTYRRRTNPTLKNHRIDVNSGLELGTTKPNQTEQKPEREPQPVALAAAGLFQFELGGPSAAQAKELPVQPKQEVSPVQFQPQTSSPALSPETPVSATPKKEKSPAEESARHLYRILGQPDQHKPKATAWTKLMGEMLEDTGADLNDWKKFLTFTMVENVSEEKQPRYTANWIPATADPCETLKDKLHQWYCWPDWQNTKRVRAKLASKKQTTNPDAEQKALDLIASLSGKQ